MRHRISGRGLGPRAESDGRSSGIKLNSLLLHERIRTTEAKARELQPMADAVVALGREERLRTAPGPPASWRTP